MNLIQTFKGKGKMRENFNVIERATEHNLRFHPKFSL